MTDAQTTCARATLEHDKAQERAPIEAITEAIFETSRVSDCNAVVIRTGDAAEAFRGNQYCRKFLDELRGA
jgi:hypothetical protein